MQKKIFLTLAFIICTLSFLPISARAASVVSCPTIGQGPPCQEFGRADLVFTGLVTEVIAVDWRGSNLAPTSAYQRLTARLLVEEAFRGVKDAEVIFEMNDCPYPFKQGERYLVYAHKDREGKPYLRIGSSRTRPVADAVEDLEFLRGLSTTQPGTRVYGKAIRHTLNVKESRYDSEPLIGVKVTLEGNNQNHEAVTDGEGKYQFAGLAFGSYSVRAELPDHLTFKGHNIKVTGQGCLPLDISASRDGQIRGRILNVDGDPVASVPVSLVSADAPLEEILAGPKDKYAWTFGVTNTEGRFDFAQVGPGRYLLIINRAAYEKTRGNDRAQTLPRLFYPGVTVMDQAEVIEVREGAPAREYNFRLPTR